MKPTIKLLALLMVLFLNSCKKEKDTTPALQCKLSTIDRGNGNKHSYAYDASGKISSMTRILDGTGSGQNLVTYVYNFTRDAAGQITKSVITVNGQDGGTETYTYTAGKLTKATFDGGINNIKYDAMGRMTEFTYELTNAPEQNGKNYYEYDTNGVLVKSGYSDLNGTTKYFEAVTKPIGASKVGEALLVNNGLPFDLLVGAPWSSNIGGIGSITEIWILDENGAFVKVDEEKLTDIKANAKGYVTEYTNNSGIQKFEYLDCQ